MSKKSKIRILSTLAILALALATSAVADGGDLWALGAPSATRDAPMSLYKLGTATGTPTFVVTTSQPRLRGLAVDPTSGKLYSSFGVAAGSDPLGIVEIDPTTGTVTPIGGTLRFVSLAFDSSGQLYGVVPPYLGLGDVYRIDKSTGAETYLGTAPPSANFGSAIAVDSTTGTLYYKTWAGELSTIDTTSGVATFVGWIIDFYYDASLSFDFDENGNTFHTAHPSYIGDLSLAVAGDLLNVAYVGYTGVAVRGLAYELPDVAEVIVDVDLGDDTNMINPRSKGVVPVAILTTDDFDAWEVDASTLAFGPDGAAIAHAQGHAQDVDGDGDLDMVVHFRIQQTGIACGDTEATLTGVTFGGQAIEGTDVIQTSGCQ